MRAGALALRVLTPVGVCLFLIPTASSEETPPAAAIFQIKCSGCHTVGGGVLVGPDLQGVTSRRETDWLLSFIRSSQSVIRSGDPVAADLFEAYGRQLMPDHDLARDQIESLLTYIAAGGPSARPQSPAEVPAREADQEQIEQGRRLFFGIETFANGGAACSTCHGAGRGNPLGGSSLASDLGRVFEKYRDRGLTKALRELDFPLMRSLYAQQPLTADERFALKAYLFGLAGGSAPAAVVAQEAMAVGEAP